MVLKYRGLSQEVCGFGMVCGFGSWWVLRQVKPGVFCRLREDKIEEMWK